MSMYSKHDGRPNFFIIGAPKCGTTALASWLSEHPRVFMCPIKETQYYSRDLENRRVRTARRYRRLFSGVADRHAAVGEASVWYLYSEEAVPAILSEVPEARLIVCLRNPVEMVYSLHGQLVLNAHEHITDFREAWDAQEERARGENVSPFCLEPRILEYGRICSLGAQMERLLSSAPREQVLPVLLDDVAADPASCYRSVLSFLNVEYDGRREFPVVNPANERRVPAFHKVVQAANLLKRRMGLPRLGTGISALLDWVNKKPSTRPGLDDTMRKRLTEYFMPDIEKLERLLDRDLSAWTGGAREMSRSCQGGW